MSTTNDVERVSPDECTRMRERYDESDTIRDIAADLGWARSTVSRHIHGICSHGDHAGIDDCTVDRPHLTQDPPEGTHHTAAKRSEAYCRGCNARITVTPDGLELGHRTKHTGRHERCTHRPDELDSS